MFFNGIYDHKKQTSAKPGLNAVERNTLR